ADFRRVALPIRNGLLHRFERHIPVFGYLFGRFGFLLTHELAVERPRPDAFAFDAELLVTRPGSAFQILPLARLFGHGVPSFGSIISAGVQHHNDTNSAIVPARVKKPAVSS